MGFIPNPWVILAFVIALAFTAFTSYEKGSHDGSAFVHAAWTAADLVSLKAHGARVDANAKITAGLQKAADDQRKDDNAKLKAMDTRLAAANLELQQRPPRPSGDQSAAGNQPAGAGPESGGCTGAGLYRDDALLLDGKADLFQRIRMQRDSCYTAYDKARAAVAQLQCQ